MNKERELTSRSDSCHAVVETSCHLLSIPNRHLVVFFRVLPHFVKEATTLQKTILGLRAFLGKLNYSRVFERIKLGGGALQAHGTTTISLRVQYLDSYLRSPVPDEFIAVNHSTTIFGVCRWSSMEQTLERSQGWQT